MTRRDNVETDRWVAELAADRHRLDRGSAAELVADVLRQRIAAGFFVPGARLAESELSDALGVSRNTLREAFRLLSHEGLVSHELHRGVFVRIPTREDIVDLYRGRRIVECGAVKAFDYSHGGLSAVRAAVEAGHQAAREERWHDVGTADLSFHQALTALAGSERLDELMGRILAELRLVFHLMSNPREFHRPYLERNRGILELLESGQIEKAAAELERYLLDAELELCDAAVNAKSPS